MSKVSTSIYLHDDGSELLDALDSEVLDSLSKEVQKEFYHPIYELEVGITADTETGQFEVTHFVLGKDVYKKVSEVDYTS